MTTTTVQLSEQQQAVVQAVTKNNRNLMVTAVAGSGKTTTLVEILRVLGNYRVAFCAFSKDISLDIQNKVNPIKGTLKCQPFIGTTHSFGLGAITKTLGKKGEGWINDKKIDNLMDIVSLPTSDAVGVPQRLQNFVRKMYRLSRQWGVGVLPEFNFGRAEAWADLIEHFDLEDDLFSDNEDRELFDIDALVAEGTQWTIACIKLGAKVVETIIDFDDMIYLPLYLNLHMWTYKVVLVDECQDINPTRRALVRKMVAVGGRAIFVGDERQAIFGFTGADSESVKNIVKEFNCVEMPLTFSFRCPKKVVEFAHQWVSHIESTPNAPEGHVDTILSEDLFAQNLTVKDAILCRNNAPLVELFFGILGKGIPVHIEGKDIGLDLVKMINRFAKIKNRVILMDKLDDYAEKQIQKFLAKGKEMLAERVADMVAAIKAVDAHLAVTDNVTDLKNSITSMFVDDNGNKRPTLTLTTIHKAKGREWNRVFWFGRNLYNPSPYARKDWQKIAEDNLCYVAATRAKDTLIDVRATAKPKRTA